MTASVHGSPGTALGRRDVCVRRRPACCVSAVAFARFHACGYNPNTGRFLSTDPVAGGNANTYTYPTDPINGQDLDGNIGLPTKREKAACKRRGKAGCAQVLRISAIAFSIAPGESDASNGRRHFVLAALLSLSFGRNAALDVLASHEPPNSAHWKADDWRDWNNNYAGLDAADQLRWARRQGLDIQLGASLVKYRQWKRNGLLWCVRGKSAALCGGGGSSGGSW